MTSDDRAYVLDSWTRSFALASLAGLHKRASDVCRLVKAAFAARHQSAVCLWLNRGVTVVAALEGAPDVLVGFASGEHDHDTGLAVYHYCYVRSAYRRQGAGGALIAELRRRLGDNDPSKSPITTHDLPGWQGLLTRPLRAPWVAWA